MITNSASKCHLTNVLIHWALTVFWSVGLIWPWIKIWDKIGAEFLWQHWMAGKKILGTTFPPSLVTTHECDGRDLGSPGGFPLVAISSDFWNLFTEMHNFMGKREQMSFTLFCTSRIGKSRGKHLSLSNLCYYRSTRLQRKSAWSQNMFTSGEKRNSCLVIRAEFYFIFTLKCMNAKKEISCATRFWLKNKTHDNL